MDHYAPDYKSEKRMSKYKRESIFGSTEMELSNGPIWQMSEPKLPKNFGLMEAVCADGQHRFLPDAPKCGCGKTINRAVERARLEREVVEAAKSWTSAILNGAHAQIAADNELRDAVDALIEFESKEIQK